MEQLRIGTKLHTRKNSYFPWGTVDHETINAAKRANGLNSTTAHSLPSQTSNRRYAERRVNDVGNKEGQRRKFQRRA